MGQSYTYPDEEMMMTDGEVSVDRDGDQGQDRRTERAASDTRVHNTVLRVQHGVLPASQIQQPESHDVTHEDQV